MQRFFGWLSEKDRRQYAAVEAAKRTWWGRVHRAGLGVHPKTIRQGLHDLEEAEDAAAGASETGGRPQRVVAQPTLKRPPSTAARVHGDPMREGVLWTNLSLRELSRRLWHWVPRQSAHNPSGAAQTQLAAARREEKTMGHHPTATLVRKHRAPAARYEAAGDAGISIDTKKKRITGEFSPERHDLHR